MVFLETLSAYISGGVCFFNGKPDALNLTAKKLPYGPSNKNEIDSYVLQVGNNHSPSNKDKNEFLLGSIWFGSFLNGIVTVKDLLAHLEKKGFMTTNATQEQDAFDKLDTLFSHIGVQDVVFKLLVEDSLVSEDASKKIKGKVLGEYNDYTKVIELQTEGMFKSDQGFNARRDLALIGSTQAEMGIEARKALAEIIESSKVFDVVYDSAWLLQGLTQLKNPAGMNAKQLKKKINENPLMSEKLALFKIFGDNGMPFSTNVKLYGQKIEQRAVALLKNGKIDKFERLINILFANGGLENPEVLLDKLGDPDSKFFKLLESYDVSIIDFLKKAVANQIVKDSDVSKVAEYFVKLTLRLRGEKSVEALTEFIELVVDKGKVLDGNLLENGLKTIEAKTKSSFAQEIANDGLKLLTGAHLEFTGDYKKALEQMYGKEFLVSSGRVFVGSAGFDGAVVHTKGSLKVKKIIDTMTKLKKAHSIK